MGFYVGLKKKFGLSRVPIALLSARDPFFYYAGMAIANQDAAFAGDFCIRCHSPAGWLEGRSVPTDGSALNLNDRQGVQCDFCIS